MSIGVFADKTHVPAQTEITTAVGPMWKLWLALLQHIRISGPVEEELKFMYGQKYGWALRCRRKGTLLTALYPTQNGFTVQIILNPAAMEEVQQLKFGNNVQQAVARAHPYPEGRWLFVPIECEKDLADVQRLFALKEGKARRAKAGP